MFSRHPECYDAETIELFTRHNEDPFGFRNLHYVHSVEESKRLNDMPGPMVILATSGMVEAGRILHHLMNGIGNPNNTVLIVGYMAEGTLGRAILEGAKRIRLYLPCRIRLCGKDEDVLKAGVHYRLTQCWLTATLMPNRHITKMVTQGMEQLNNSDFVPSQLLEVDELVYAMLLDSQNHSH